MTRRGAPVPKAPAVSPAVLRTIALFAGVGAAPLRALAAAGRVVAVAPGEVLAERDRLLGRGLRPLDGEGDGYVVDGNDLLIKVAATDAHDEAFHVANFAAPPNTGYVLLVRQFTKAVAALARRADTPASPPVLAG